MKKHNVEKFIDTLEKTCKSNNVKLVLHDMCYIIDNGDKFGGWFDPYLKELHCSFPNKIKPKYVEVLIHESCHLDQWIKQTPVWVKEQGNRSLEIFWDWTKGNKANNITWHLKNIQKMEAECERMSIQKIVDLDLGLNIERYTKKANAYLLFYTILKETKKWCDYPPYKFKEIWNQLPGDRILNEFSMTDKLKKLYIDKCYKVSTKKKLLQ